MKFTVFAFLMLFASHSVNAQASPSPSKADQTNPDLHVDPSSAKVSLGKATLIVNPLTYKGKLYVGDYQLTVVPYFFMSETGVLELTASDDAMRKLLGGTAVPFTGKASNNKQGKPKAITVTITPTTRTQGNVTFSVETDNGPMVFNNTYHFGE